MILIRLLFMILTKQKTYCFFMINDAVDNFNIIESFVHDSNTINQIITPLQIKKEIDHIFTSMQ